MSTEFSNPNVASLKVNVYLDSDSTITDSNNLCGFKSITVKNVNKNISVAEADYLLRLLLGENTYDVSSLEKVTTCDVLFNMEFLKSDVAPIFDGTYQLSGRNVFTYEDTNPIFDGSYQLSGRNTFTADDINKIFN